MAKKELTLRTVVSPTETVVVSAYDENGRADACTLAFYMCSSHLPPCVTVAIDVTKKRKTLKDILERNAFVLSFPGTDRIREVDYLGTESGFAADKLKNLGLTTTKRRTVDAPVINEFMLNIECQVINTNVVGNHMQITGEVKNILADESILNGNNRVVLEKLSPVIYDEEQRRYMSVGEKVRDAFVTGNELKKKLAEKS